MISIKVLRGVQEVAGERPLSSSVLYNYEIPTLGVASWGARGSWLRGTWSPEVLLIDLLGTCATTSASLRKQLIAGLPSWYMSATR